MSIFSLQISDVKHEIAQLILIWQVGYLNIIIVYEMYSLLLSDLNHLLVNLLFGFAITYV